MNYFERPYVLFLIPFVFFVAFLYYKFRFFENKYRLDLSNQTVGKQNRILQFFQTYFPFLKFIALILLIISLAGPGSEVFLLPDEKSGVDIFISLDISGSMVRGEDLQPNRLEAAKNIIKDFIQNRTKDRIGIIAFAGAAYLQSPLTSDRETLREILQDMDNSIIEEQGTAIGDAILLSTLRLKNSKAKSKILILITDGSSNAGKIDPQTAAEIAKQMEIKIYTIGIGKEDPNTIELDFGSLEKISNLTNGNFYRATDSNELEKIFDSIDSLEKDRFDSKPKKYVESFFAKFLIYAILILCLDLMIRSFYLRYYT